MERRCAENGYVYVTKTVMAVWSSWTSEYYEHTMQKIQEAKSIIEGLEDVENGHTLDGEKSNNQHKEQIWNLNLNIA